MPVNVHMFNKRFVSRFRDCLVWNAKGCVIRTGKVSVEGLKGLPLSLSVSLSLQRLTYVNRVLVQPKMNRYKIQLNSE